MINKSYLKSAKTKPSIKKGEDDMNHKSLEEKNIVKEIEMVVQQHLKTGVISDWIKIIEWFPGSDEILREATKNIIASDLATNFHWLFLMRQGHSDFKEVAWQKFIASYPSKEELRLARDTLPCPYDRKAKISLLQRL